ncbi:PAS domain-containing sensor histidine kinase [Phyllobacterium lublinensis]|uniref:PAS domain-containing sensor histidine kinase n=1 Tax=Phyllobacterium lublinensis TaxID=2875708 RepID=UPI001CCF1267|nr:ATP-binding protein [Phyllobacterium sp. 2063]MBZ9656231.1 PAS domain-containing protein [Phyllobacterium sp. 2063]
MELADYATDSVIRYDLDGTIRYCNPASETQFGWKAAKLLGRHFHDLMPDRAEASSLWKNLLRIGRWDGLLQRRLQSEVEIGAYVRLTVRHDSRGRPLDVVEYAALSMNSPVPSLPVPPLIAERGGAACWQFNIKRARPLLDADAAATGYDANEQEWHPDRLDTLLAAVQIVDVNDEAIRLFGLPADRDKIVDRRVASLWPEQSRAALGDLLTAIAAKTDTEPETREIPVVDRLQHVVLTGWRAADPRCPDIVFVRVNAILNAPNAVIELEASQNRYRNLISFLPVPVWQIDARAAGRIFDRLKASGITDLAAYSEEHPELVDLTCDIVQVFDVNDEAMQLFGGRQRSDFIGPARYLFDGTPGAARRVMLAHFSGVRNHVEELKVKTFDGRLIDVLLLMTFPVPGERRDTTIVMMMDNSARLEAEAKLRIVEGDFSHAARLSTLGEMTTSIAHEIKQPLSAILMNAQTSLRYLRKADPNLEKADQLTSRIVESAQRANDIIGRIQDMAGKRDPIYTLLDFNDVVHQCLVFLRHESEEKLVVIKARLQPDLPPIHGDRIQLQQVIVNLIVNSIQAMNTAPQTQREIYLETSVDEDDHVACSIRDTGTGIPADHMDQIFDGFFTTKEDGLGIGLAICQSIVRAHGGEITAANHPEGGAVFRFWIPTGSTAEL